MTYGWNWGQKVDKWLKHHPELCSKQWRKTYRICLVKNMVFNATILDMYIDIYKLQYKSAYEAPYPAGPPDLPVEEMCE